MPTTRSLIPPASLSKMNIWQTNSQILSFLNLATTASTSSSARRPRADFSKCLSASIKWWNLAGKRRNVVSRYSLWVSTLTISGPTRAIDLTYAGFATWASPKKAILRSTRRWSTWGSRISDAHIVRDPFPKNSTFKCIWETSRQSCLRKEKISFRVKLTWSKLEATSRNWTIWNLKQWNPTFKMKMTN